MYFATVLLALCAAVLCAIFSIIGGLGWLFLGPTFLSAICLVAGLILFFRKPIIGSCISAAGAVLCGLALAADIIELIHAIPFQQQPRQTLLLLPPGLFIVVMLVHIRAAMRKYSAVKAKESWRVSGNGLPR